LKLMIEEFPPAEVALPPIFEVRRATAGYFEAMNIPLVEGRLFTPDDHNRPLPSIIISNSVKARYWPQTSALGKRIDLGKLSARVVGVAGDVHNAGLDELRTWSARHASNSSRTARRLLHIQTSRNAWRCHAMTVSGLTMTSAKLPFVSTEWSISDAVKRFRSGSLRS
jgi:MacB-like periplasmic core domain